MQTSLFTPLSFSLSNSMQIHIVSATIWLDFFQRARIPTSIFSLPQSGRVNKQNKVDNKNRQRRWNLLFRKPGRKLDGGDGEEEVGPVV